MNVAYPLIDERGDALLRRQARGAGGRGRASPNFIEQNLTTILRRPAPTPRCTARTCCRWPANTRRRCSKGMRAFLERYALRRSTAAPRCCARPTRDRRARRRQPAARRQCARAPAGLLHRLPRAADLQRDEAGRAGARPAPRQRRHRLPPVLDPAAVQPRHHDDGLRPRRRRRASALNVARARQARDRGHGRRRLLAQRADQRHRQRGVQQARQRDVVVDNNYSAATGGQDILSSRAANAHAQHRPRDRASGARRRRRVGAHDRPHLRRRRRCATRCSEALTTKAEGPEGDRRAVASAC